MCTLKVSIVIPVYNGITFLQKTFSSIFEQTYQNIEVLAIDDFSTDGSYEYLMKLQSMHSNLRLVRPKSKLYTASKGIEYALNLLTGDYYFYMSQDDFMEKDLIEKCIKIAESTDAEIVVPDCYSFYSENRIEKTSIYPCNNMEEIPPKDAFLLSLDWEIHGFTLRKTSLFKKTGFKGEYYNSDEYYTRLHFLNANKIVCSDAKFYYNQTNPNAITKKLKPNQTETMFTNLLLLDLLYKKCFDKKKLNEMKKKLRNQFLFWSVFYNRYGFNKEEQEIIQNNTDLAIKSYCTINEFTAMNKKIFVFFLKQEIILRKFYRNLLGLLDVRK